jgi:MFS family permease
MIVIAEAVIGLLHSVEAERREDSERKLTLALLMYSILAIGVVVLEATLYGQVQPDSTALQLPIGGSAFALVGAILGAAVFGLGRLAHSSAASWLKERTPRALAKQFRILNEAASKWNSVAEPLQRTQKVAYEQFERLITLCRQTSKAQEHVAQQFAHEIDTHRESPPAWARPTERSLSQSEFTEHESRMYLWTAVAALSTISLVVLCVHFELRLGAWVGAAVGLGLAVSAFAAGALGSQKAPNEHKWRVLWYLLLLSLVCVLVFTSARLLRPSQTTHSIFFLITAVGAFVSGIQIGSSTALFTLPVMRIGHRLIDAVLYFGVIFVWLVNILVAIIEYLARLLAWPTIMIIKIIRSKSDAGSHATIT